MAWAKKDARIEHVVNTYMSAQDRADTLAECDKAIEALTQWRAALRPYNADEPELPIDCAQCGAKCVVTSEGQYCPNCDAAGLEWALNDAHEVAAHERGER